MANVVVGVCGFPASRSKLFRSVDAVELQETFYDMPTQERLSKLKSEAPEGFVFTVKVIQALTHSPSSPTWRRLRRVKLSNAEGYGLLRPTRENAELWEEFRNVTKVLNPKVYVFQTPPSLRIIDVSQFVDFFNMVKGKDYYVAWEPRGHTYDDADSLRVIFNRVDVIHVVDPFKRSPIVARDVLYFRLHGIGPGEVNYRYKYTDGDLTRLKGIVEGYGGLVYVFFNNVYMFDDASRFRSMVKGEKG